MLLLTPGPTAVPEKIRMRMSEPTIHHRTPEFSEIFRQPDPQLGYFFGFFTMGSILSLLMILTGVILQYYFKKKR